MERLKTVAGLKMQKLLEMVNTEIHFVTVCAFQVSAELRNQEGMRSLAVTRSSPGMLSAPEGVEPDPSS